MMWDRPETDNTMTKAEHFAFMLIEEFTHLAFANAVEPLRIANLVSGEPLYRWSFIAAGGTEVTASNGVTIRVHHGLDSIPSYDRLFVLAGTNARQHISRAHLAALRHARSRGTPLGALCSGTYALALAGLLNGHRAAIHWEFHDSFAEEFPEIDLVRSVFVDDAPIVTASGGSATADLMLKLIAARHGEDIAITVADQMVYNAVRDGSAAQRVSLQARTGLRSPRLAHAIQIMRNAVEQPVSIRRIAEDVGVSTRQLERIFVKHLNTSPKKFMLDLRLERARYLLLQTEMSVIDVAIATGFESPSHFARVYRTAFGMPPNRQRNRMT